MKDRIAVSRCWSLAACLGLAVTVAGCTGADSDSSGPIISQTIGPIPAPDSTLTEASSDSLFLQYGDSLQFAAVAPGFVVHRRGDTSSFSELRIRSELRLPNTDSAAYLRGRIIAKFETVGGASSYGTPVGNAYLWVRDTGGGHHAGTLIYRNYITGATGRTPVVSQMHSLPRSVLGVSAECVDFSGSVGDTTRVCCLCGDGRYNCPFSARISFDSLDQLLTASGRLRRVR